MQEGKKEEPPCDLHGDADFYSKAWDARLDLKKKEKEEERKKEEEAKKLKNKVRRCVNM